MVRLSALTGVVLMTVALLVGTGYSGDKDKGEPKKDPPKKFGLPANWGKLGLSVEQKRKVSATRGAFYAKVKALQEQIDKLKKEEQQELLTILTDEQKDQLRKILAEKGPDRDKKSSSDKGSTDKKS